MKEKNILLLGGHMSIAGGFYKAILAGESIGCTAIQIFTKSNRQWKAKPITKEAVDLFRAAWKKSCIKSVVAHATYLINIGSPDRDVYEQSLHALEIELRRCLELGIEFLVLHPGSHLRSTEKKSIHKIIKGLDRVFERVAGKVNILLETMSGQGTQLGYRFEQIASILDQACNKKRLGVCFDTCHVFAAGYDLRAKKEYEHVMREFDKIIGFHKLQLFHINGSKKALGTRVDRHENVGKGEIGSEAFKLLFNDERFFAIPKILETPEGTLENYKMNMDFIETLLTPKTKKIFGIK